MNAPNLDLPLVPDFEVRVNSQPLSSILVSQVMRIEVEDDLRLPGMFSLELSASDDPQSGLASWLDDENLFALGARVEFTADRLPTITVRGYDARHRLQRRRRSFSYRNMKDSEIASQIGADAGIAIDADEGGVMHDYLLQANETDLGFLMTRADAIGFELMVRDGKVKFRPRANGDGAALTLELGDDLLEFFVSCSSSDPAAGAGLRGWNLKKKEAFVASADSGSEQTRMGGSQSASERVGVFGDSAQMLVSSPVTSQAEADQLVRARFETMGLGFVHAEGVCRGLSDLRPGITVKIVGAGKRFGGLYYLLSVEHRYTPDSGYSTRFSARRNAL
jgi:phage protein D